MIYKKIKSGLLLSLITCAMVFSAQANAQSARFVGSQTTCDEMGKIALYAYGRHEEGWEFEEVWWELAPLDATAAQKMMYLMMIDLGFDEKLSAKEVRSVAAQCKANRKFFQKHFDENIKRWEREIKDGIKTRETGMSLQKALELHQRRGAKTDYIKIYNEIMNEVTNKVLPYLYKNPFQTPQQVSDYFKKEFILIIK